MLHYLWCPHVNVTLYTTRKSKVRNFAHLVLANENVTSSQITMDDLKKRNKQIRRNECYEITQTPLAITAWSYTFVMDFLANLRAFKTYYVKKKKK